MYISPFAKLLFEFLEIQNKEVHDFFSCFQSVDLSFIYGIGLPFLLCKIHLLDQREEMII